MNKNYSLRLLWTGAFALLFSLTSSLFGQGQTTAAITGFVSDPSGNPIAGANVSVVHVPSGTHYSGVTRSTGQYTVEGLRPGGPYSITVTGANLAPETKDGIMLDAGLEMSTDFRLGGEVVKMEAFKVGESRDTTFDTGQMGTGITLTPGQINQISTVRRDIQDLENLDPRANVMQVSPTDSQYTISVQGQNPRENGLMIDGVSGADNFGLNSNGYAGFRNPLPPDWIESFEFDLNPYDIVNSGFLGALTNATLKSGTNEFHGSIYGYYEGTNFRGPDPVPGPLGSHEAMQAHTWGATFGGPIIKDKLFFFIGYDAFREIATSPAQLFNPLDNAADTAEVNEIVQKSVALGYNPGNLSGPSHIWNQNFVAKVDWNISDSQKFEFTFRHAAGAAPNFYNYTSSFETSFSNSWYDTYRTDQSYTAKLNSDWSSIIPNFHTEIEATYKRYNGTAQLGGADYPAITIVNVPGTASGGGTPPFDLFLGTYYAYQLNNIYTWEQEEHAIGEYSLGNHTFKFGVQFDRTAYTDTFIPNYLGSYSFTNVQDYLNGTPTGVTLETPANGFTLGSDVSHYYLLDIAPLIQDTWKPNDRLTIVGGLRIDDPYEPQNPPFSQTFYNSWGYANNTSMNGNLTIFPRLAFNYDFHTQLKTQLRGGAGLFLGENPVVWVENSFNNAGQLNSITISNSSVPIPNYTFTGNPATQPAPPAAAGTAVPSYDITDKNFHWPANWKENLALDRELPWWHIIFTAEVDITQVEEDVAYKNLNLKQATSGNAYMPDGAIRYAGNITPSNIGTAYYVPAATGQAAFPGYLASSSTGGFFEGVTSSSTSTLETNTTSGPVYELTNTTKGGSQEYTLELHRPMIDGWAFSLAYSHTHGTQVDPLPSSVASSNVADNYYLNPNDLTAYRSQYVTPDKFVATLTKDINFFKRSDAYTRISLQFLEQTGQAYSAVFKGDGDGSGGTGQSLFYVPSGPSDPKVVWLSPTEQANFFQWLNGTPDIAKYAGHVVPRNALWSGEERYFNLHFEQGVPVWGPVRMKLYCDIFDLGNLLNHNWGTVTNYDNSFESRTIAGTGYNATGNGGAGQYVYTFNAATLGLPTEYSDMSRWAIQIGAKLEF